jgi:uncharacterized protein (UPF0332 family)
MMRSGSLKACLEGPFLWYDETAVSLTAKDLESAEKLYKDAQEKKDPIDMLNTAYMSMYCATQALLHSIKYKSTGFRCTVSVLEEYFVKNGKLERIHVDHLLRAQKLEGTPQENVAAAGPYIEAVKGILQK